MSTYSNSPLVTYTKISPNKTSPRNHSIDRISVHCIVAQWTAKQGADYFSNSSVQASANYVVGKDGSVGLSVEEKDRSWCTSSKENDNRAVTIETASDKTDPYAVTDAAFNKLLDLCTDICKRNGKTKLIWFGDKNKTLNYVPKSNEMVMTVHRWFKQNKACPGDYLYSLHPLIAEEVTRRLGGGAPKTYHPSTGDRTGSTTSSSSSGNSSSSSNDEIYRIRKSWDKANTQIGAYKDLAHAKKECDKYPGYYVFDSKGNTLYPIKNSKKEFKVRVDTADLNIRTGPGTNYPKTGKYTGKGIFTITEEKEGWGKLKSNQGWIKLSYTKRI